MKKETLIKWMEESPHSNEWLAEQCQVKPKTVSSWRSDRPIPSKAALIIQSLMEIDKAKKDARRETSQNLVLNFSEVDFEKIEAAALGDGKTAREWCKKTINEAANQDMEKLATPLRLLSNVAEDPAEYRTDVRS